MSGLKGFAAGTKPDQRDSIFGFWGVAASEKKAEHSVIREVKNSERRYRFIPRKLWRILVEKRLVPEEGYTFHQAAFKDKIAEALERDVDPLFKQLASADARVISAMRPL